jgi:hypothetical protein
MLCLTGMRMLLGSSASQVFDDSQDGDREQREGEGNAERVPVALVIPQLWLFLQAASSSGDTGLGLQTAQHKSSGAVRWAVSVGRLSRPVAMCVLEVPLWF